MNHQSYTIHSTHHSTYPPQCPSLRHPIPSITFPSSNCLFPEVKSLLWFRYTVCNSFLPVWSIPSHPLPIFCRAKIFILMKPNFPHFLNESSFLRSSLRTLCFSLDLKEFSCFYLKSFIILFIYLFVYLFLCFCILAPINNPINFYIRCKTRVEMHSFVEGCSVTPADCWKVHLPYTGPQASTLDACDSWHVGVTQNFIPTGSGPSVVLPELLDCGHFPRT